MKQDHPIHINIPISKIDEEQRMVWGYATVEEVDAHGEIIGYEASKKAFSNWVGNIREMHKDIAVGKAIEIEFDDDKKGVWVGSKISESYDGEQAWIKVKEGVLTGYSIGGKMHDYKVQKDGDVNRVFITDYSLSETSLVDNPAVASATFQIVKSVAGGRLQHVEKMNNKPNRQPAWWETMYKFADDQKVIKSGIVVYNKDSMAKSNQDINKSIWEAEELIYLAGCLSSYMHWKAWEGEDIEALKKALEAIKTAAAQEISEPEDWPEPLATAIELACKTLNISKKEELKTMANDLNKATIGSEERNADGEVVLTAEQTGRPLNDTAERAAENGVPTAGTQVEQDKLDADGKPTGEKETITQPIVHADDAPQGAGNSNAVDDKAKEDAAAGKVVAVPPEAGADDKDKKPAADKKDEAKPKKDAATADDISKSSTSTDDLTKSILAGVEGLIEKAIEPLQKDIALLKGAPAPSKAKGSFVDVDKVEKNEETEENKAQKEFDTLNKRADELAANPELGTQNERIQVAINLRKQARLMHAPSRAQHAAIRATFSKEQ